MRYIPVVKCPECGKNQMISYEAARKVILNGMHAFYLKGTCKGCGSSFTVSENLSFARDQEEDNYEF
jgi:ribosomal protein S27E